MFFFLSSYEKAVKLGVLLTKLWLLQVNGDYTQDIADGLIFNNMIGQEVVPQATLLCSF
jgi:hypothetical protein